MSVHHKDDCPCGSGKRYKHCHLPIDEARRRKATLAGVLVVGAIVVGVAAFGAINQWQKNKPASVLADSARAGTASVPGAAPAGGDVSGVPAPATPGAFGIRQPGLNGRAPIPTTTVGTTIPLGNSGSLAPGEHPEPWQYDVAKNRHYDPRVGHQHWHSGPPPADTTNAVVTAPRTIRLDQNGNVVNDAPSRVAGSTTTVGSIPLKPGENPQPWEYDKAKNQHYDPGHGHWHTGPAPAGKVVGTP